MSSSTPSPSTTAHATLVYIGAANELAIYRSDDAGQKLAADSADGTDFIGGVTAIAVDGHQRLLYVGTDTAGLFRLRDVGSSVIVRAAAAGRGSHPSGGRQCRFRPRHGPHRMETLPRRGFRHALGAGRKPGQRGNRRRHRRHSPATVYVGTTDRGLLQSSDGLTWKTANVGLGLRRARTSHRCPGNRSAPARGALRG